MKFILTQGGFCSTALILGLIEAQKLENYSKLELSLAQAQTKFAPSLIQAQLKKSDLAQLIIGLL